jgi:integrase
MSILSTLTIPDYRLNESTGRGFAIFGDRGIIEFGKYDDPHSVAAYDQTLAAWLANGRRLPSTDELAEATRAAGPIPFDRFCNELLELYHPKLKSVATRRGMEHALRILGELGVTDTSQFTVSLIARLVTTRDPNLSPNTVKGLLRYVQTAMTHAAKCGYVRTSPFTIRPLRSWVRGTPPKGDVRHLTKAQIRAILDLAASDVAERKGYAQWRSRRLEFLVWLLATTGLRKMEALYSKVQDFDFELNVFYVVNRSEHELKTEGSAAPVIMTPQLRDKALDWFSHRLDAPPSLLRENNDWTFPNIMVPTPWVGGSHGVRALDKFRELAVRAGVPGDVATLHSLRRSLATHMELHGCGEAMIMRQLRHSNIQTGRAHYRRADINNMHKALDGFTY